MVIGHCQADYVYSSRGEGVYEYGTRRVELGPRSYSSSHCSPSRPVITGDRVPVRVAGGGCVERDHLVDDRLCRSVRE